MTARLTVGALLALLALSAPPTATAADVSGEVKDSTGAVVIGAAVTLRSGAGSTLEARTDGRGRYRFEGVEPGAYSLIVEREGFSAAVQEVVVAADADATADATLSVASYAEEVTVAFTAPHATSGLRMDVPVRDIPLSVKSYTSSFMKAIETKRVADMYNYITGVTRAGDTGYDFTIRGVRSREPGNIQVNGLPGLAARMSSPSTVNIEKIEVLKGPASVLYGQIQPGGLINIVTKRPEAQRSHLFELRAGTYAGDASSFGDASSYRAAGDFTGPIGKSNSFLYRVLFSYDSDDSFRTGIENDEDIYVVPSVSWTSASGTVLTLELEYRREHFALDNGLVAPRNDIRLVAPIETRYQEADDHVNEEGLTGTLHFNKAFAGGLGWNATFRSVVHDDDRKGFENVSVLADGVTLSRRDRHQVNERSYQFLDNNLRKDFSTGGVRHALLVGVNGGYEKRDFDRRNFRTAPSLNVNIYNPVYGAAPLVPLPTTHRVTDFWNYGAYVQDHVTLGGKWKATAALRYDRQDQDWKDLNSGRTSDKSDSDVLPMVGLVFQPDAHWSLYGSYSTSFAPNSVESTDPQGNNDFDPERGRQYETGIKAEFLDGRVDTTLALFEITRQNVLNSVAGGFFQQVGEERSRGFEYELRAKPVRNWQVILGYAYLDAEITKDVVARRIGAPVLNTPRHSGNLWTRYDFREGTLSGFGLGLGLTYQGERVGTLPPATGLTLTLPEYTRVDSGLYYGTSRYEVTLKITNLLDKLYYDSAASQTGIRPGGPREATLSLRLKL
ncbi:MAG TPA: TonB-dependent receptor [Vicinamibacteria bacterium]|nr:TonB-dependent receptor [Vicinamibacteria bacterium]